MRGEPEDDQASTLLQHRFSPSPAPSGSFTLSVVAGPDAGQSFTIDGSQPARVLLGQSPACEIRVSDREVSRRHAALELVGERLRITDLGSTNGTLIDHVAVNDALLSGSESIRVGATTFRVERRVDGREPASIEWATHFGRMIGASREMRRLYSLCQKIAASTVPVVIEGETGTGKEVLAEALHEQGPRANGPFVVFDCTAVPPNLVESELFGHERGAFTGAVGARRGIFEQAHGGTLFIDEIGDLDITLQPKLLRAIERSEIRRVGGDKRIVVDVRILSATRRDLDREVQAGRFRDDLFHRLAVARIELPPLRARKGDIAVLVRHFVEQLGGDAGSVTHEILTRWEDYPWPGNVRELRNAVARWLALGEVSADKGGTSFASQDLVESVLAMNLPIVQARRRMLDEFDRRYLERVLAEHGGVVTRAAEASGIARRHFQRLRARVPK